MEDAMLKSFLKGRYEWKKESDPTVAKELWSIYAILFGENIDGTPAKEATR